MLHFSCDLCGCPLNNQRYVVKLEVAPAFDPDELTVQDLESDHLASVADELHELELNGEDAAEDAGEKSFRFDLCPRCRDKFVKDPLPRETARRPNFSQN